MCAKKLINFGLAFGILRLEVNFDNLIGLTCILCWHIGNCCMLVFRRVQIRHVCLSVRMDHLGSHRTGFQDFFFRNFVEKIQVTLQSQKKDRHVTCRHKYIHDNISLYYFQNKKFLRHKFQRKSKHTCNVNTSPFFRKSCCI